MKLELKESNSPFWLLGLNKGKVTQGSSTNIPCYYKAGKKQYDLAKQISKVSGIDEVYLITGVVWDNMKGSWGVKEAGSYIQNKGKLIWSKNEITNYMNKYEGDDKDMNLELKEDKYPKGVSRDPLPKNGVKVYTSVATPLESKSVKESTSDNLLNKDELKQLRKEIVLGSLYLSDYENSFNIDPKAVKDLCDGFIEDVWDKVNNRDDYFKEYSDKSDEELIDMDIHNFESFYDYYTSIEDNIVVKPTLESKECKFKPELKDVEECGTLKEGSTKLLLSKGDRFENGDTTWEVINQNSEYTLINAIDASGNLRTDRFAVVWGLQEDGTWNQGHYFTDINRATEYFEKETIVPVEESISQDKLIKKYNLDLNSIKQDGYDLIVFRCSTCAKDLANYNPYVYDDGTTIPLNKIKVIEVEDHDDHCENSEKNMDQNPQAYAPIQLWKINDIEEAVSPQSIMTAVMFTVDNWDKLKDIIETFKSLSNEAYEKALTAFKYLQDTGANIKDAAQEIGDIFIKNESVSLKESKIVEPIGNPQTSSSFVNIDVDLDHMEVSDFIVRLAQAVRSEQTAILEYVALRSANGITNADRSVIDGIIEEEKNHLVAITTLLYKQILENHSENVDQANKEFELPKFGMEIFDNTKEGKLQESIQTTVDKLSESSITMSDDFYVGDNETGQIFHGLSNALNVIQKLITTSGNEVLVYNNTLASQANESMKLTEETFNTIDELIKELSTDANYDEIAYHIHCYSKTNKARALELMDMLFELERNKSPKECRDEIINHLEEENKQYKTEDTKITQKDKKYNVEVDVEYDSDVANQVFDNISREVAAYNDKNDFELTELGLKEGKFYFTINKQVTEQDVENICKDIFDKATNYSYQINIK